MILIPGHWRRHLALLLLLLGSSLTLDRSPDIVNQAVIWLPTGVGIAGLWFLGARAG